MKTDEKNFRYNLERFRAKNKGMQARLSFILRVYYFAGIFVGLTSLALFAYSFIEPFLNMEQKGYLAVSVMGFLFAYASYAYLLFFRRNVRKREEESKKKVAYINLIRKFSNFEEKASIISESFEPDSKTLSPSSLITSLIDNKIITDDEIQSLNEITHIRNKIVHDSYKPEIHEVNEAANELDEIIRKISKHSSAMHN